MITKLPTVATKTYLVALPLLPAEDYIRFRTDVKTKLKTDARIGVQIPRMEPHITIKLPFPIAKRKKIGTTNALAKLFEEIVRGNKCFRATEIAFGDTQHFDCKVLYLPIGDAVDEMRLVMRTALEENGIDPDPLDVTCPSHFSIFKKVHVDDAGQAIQIIQDFPSRPRIARLSQVSLYEKVGKHRTTPICTIELP